MSSTDSRSGSITAGRQSNGRAMADASRKRGNFMHSRLQDWAVRFQAIIVTTSSVVGGRRARN